MREHSLGRFVRMTSLISVGLVIGFLFLSLFLYCMHLSGEIEKRFSGRRWSIPSRVFSDTTILYPGLSINPSLFYEKLDRLRYRQIPQEPTRAGEFYRSASTLDIFLHDVEIPNRSRRGFLARIRFSRDRIKTIEDLRAKKLGSGYQCRCILVSVSSCPIFSK